MPERCLFCSNVGAEKGIDEWEHTHCRLCSGYTVDGNFGGRHREIIRTSPATGETWKVWCGGKCATAKAIRNRNAPAPFEAPDGVFR